MTETLHPPPPLSPVLLAGFALRPLPPAMLRPFLAAAMTAIYRRHPDVFGRLKTLGDADFLIDPVDLPFNLLLRPGAAPPVLAPVGDGDDVGKPTAIICGPLLALIDLLEGRLDGDALFFSRDLVIEGDTEAVLTLRNAVDSGEIDVAEDLLSLLGPISAPARHMLAVGGAVFARAARDLETLRASLVAPVVRRCDLQATDLCELEERVAELQRELRRRKPARRRAAETGPREV
ncbi:MAG: SCP2 domain-containing protein [Alphaproteobacteria bacterium]